MQTKDDAVPTPRFFWRMVVLVCLLAAGLRGALAVVNREANDNHYEVIELILEGRTGLTMADCHECFHPKLFYYVCAAMFRVGGIANEASRIVAGQLLNAVAGMLTLGIVLAALNRTPVDAKWRLWTFALIALNPRLIAINGQLSNDSFAILFATGAIYLTLRLLQSPSLLIVVATQLLLSCALMTKGTTWVVALAMMIVFLVRALLEESNRRSLFFVGLCAATTLNGWASIELAGYDFHHYDIYANMGRDQPLNIWEKTRVGRPGIQSIVDGYLTFRFTDLLLDPQITNGVAIEQAHRTSVWTQLYARANFAQYEQHPPTWLTTDAQVMHVARCSLVLGLLPLLFLLVGLARGGLRSLLGWRSWGVPQSNDYAGFFCTLVCFGYVAFIIKFTADYRDFAAMKLIYMLPGVLPFAWVLAEGMQAVMDRLHGGKTTEWLLHAVLLSLVVSYCVGIVALVLQLA